MDHPATIFDYIWLGFTHHLQKFTALYSHKRKRMPSFGRERQNILWVFWVMVAHDSWHMFCSWSIRHEMSKVQSLLNSETYTLGEPVSHREFHLVVLVVIAAVLNPGNTLHILSFGSVSDIPLVTTGWDVARLTDRVKNTRVKKDGITISCRSEFRKIFWAKRIRSSTGSHNYLRLSWLHFIVAPPRNFH